MKDQEQERKEDGKIQPLKMTPEQLEKRRETGYKTDEESRRTPSTSGGNGSRPEQSDSQQQGSQDVE